MDCFRSGRDEEAGPREAGAVAAGFPPLDDVEGPKKSSPSSVSAGLDGLGSGADGALGFMAGSVVRGRGAGMSSSPNKSTFCAGLGGCASWPVAVVLGVDDERSNFCFSWTTPKGCQQSASNPMFGSVETHTTSSSPSASSVAGSGIGPSITQRFDSYFVRMKFSIFLSENQPLSMLAELGNQERTLQKVHDRERAWLPSIYNAVSLALFEITVLGGDQLVCSQVSPLKNALHLLVGPGVQIHRLDSADVRAHTTMDARTSMRARIRYHL